MKVGILTFNNTINYGALLQAFALQETLKKIGCEPEIINYTNVEIEQKEINKLKSKRNIKSVMKEIVMGKQLKIKQRKFKDFEKKNIILGKSIDDSCEEINNYYDYFITGSDQVWNMSITHKDWKYFLDFVSDDSKKISYAPSFGNQEFPIEEYEKARMLLKKFKGLSVREQSGVDFIKKIINGEVKLVLDPTLLLNKNDWKRLIKFKPSLDHYILVYFPHNKKKVFDFVKKLKRETKLPVVYISISPKKQFGVKTIYDASPDEFLGWFFHADYIVTGSFHGTAFSLNFEKQFFYETKKENSRIESLVNLTGTKNRGIDRDNIYEKIDYKKVKNKLEALRSYSLSWLKGMIQNEGK